MLCLRSIIGSVHTMLIGTHFLKVFCSCPPPPPTGRVLTTSSSGWSVCTCTMTSALQSPTHFRETPSSSPRTPHKTTTQSQTPNALRRTANTCLSLRKEARMRAFRLGERSLGFCSSDVEGCEVSSCLWMQSHYCWNQNVSVKSDTYAG